MKRYPVKNINPLDLAPSVSSPSEVPESSFDVEKLLNTAGEILQREIRNIMFESSKGKLSATSSKNLVDYIRLLEDIKQEQKNDLEDMSDEQLAVIAKNSNNSSQDK